MHLSRRKAQLLAAGVLGGFFLVGMLLTGTKSNLGSVPKIELGKNADGTMQARVVIGEFRKSETKDGKKVWEVTAATARYFPDKNIAELENGLVWLYRGDDVVRVSSNLAIIHLKGTGLDKVQAKGSVVLESEARGITLKTEEANFDQAQEELNCPGLVEITAPQGEISGIGLTGDTGAQNFTLLKDVKTRLKPQSEQTKPAQKKEGKK